MTEPPDRELAVFSAARHLPVGKRAAYLAEACAGDPTLRQRVEELLKAGEEAGAFLDHPAPGTPRTGEGAGSSDPSRTVRIPGSPAEKAGDRIGRYKLLQQIGEGGCGVVYLAEQEEPVRRQVALKVIKLGMDTKSVIARFEAEQQALALMDHPNIAKVLDAGATETGRPYFVMELVRGIRITDYCDRNNLPTRERLNLFVQVCQAIQHAHQKGIIHRDIKPSNILVTLRDGVPVPKVIDFGIAKATTDQRLTDKTLFTAFEQFIGTPAYMSPEQAEMSELGIDTRSDIYSLGVLLYELLTGQTPFEAKDLLQAGLNAMRRIIREQEPARPSTRLSTLLAGELTIVAGHRQTEPSKLVHLLRGDLDWIVIKSLEKDRARRYETANGLAADIQRHLNNEPVSARPPSKLYRFQKSVQRNLLAFVAVTALVGILSLGVIVSTWEAVRATQAEKQQSLLRQDAQQAQKIEAQQRQAADTARAEESRQRRIASEQEMLARRRFYDAQMNLASQAWGSGEFARTADLLETQQPRRGEPDLRSFEWYYFWGLCNSHLLRTIRAHTDSVFGVAISPDGTMAASVGSDGTIPLWDTATGSRRLLPLTNSSGASCAVAFSPDGKTLAAEGDYNFVKLWDVATGQLVTTLRQLHGVRCLAFSPNGKLLASGGDPGPDGIVATINDTATYQPLTTLTGNKGPVTAVAFSPDGSTLAVGSSWGDDGGACYIRSLTDNTNPSLANLGRADSLSFSPDGKTLAAATWDGIHLWDATGWKPLRTLKGHIGVSPGLSFLPDSHSLVSCGADRTVRLWQWPADEPSNAVGRVIGMHLDAALCLAVSRDGNRVVTGANDGSIKLWNIATPDDLENSIIEFKYDDDGGNWHGLWSVLPLPDHKRVLVITQDGGELRDMVTGHKLASWPEATGRGALSPDGKLLATGYKDGVLKLWDVAMEKLIASVNTEFASPFLTFSPDGRTLASSGAASGTGRSNPIIRLWEANGMLNAIRTMDTGNPFVNALAYSPDGKTLATAPGITLFDTSNYWDLGTIRSANWGNVTSLVFSPDSKTLATGREGGVVCLWDAQTGQLLYELKGHASTVWALAFSPDGSTLASGSADATVRLWDVQTGQERVTLTSSNSQLTVKSVAFADGSTLIIGFEDGWVSIRRGIHRLEADIQAATVEKSADTKSSFLESRADGLARHAQWKPAIAIMTNLVELDPDGDRSYQLATLLVASKDSAGYRQFCPSFLARFKGSTDPYVANRAAKVCIILPSSNVDLKNVAALADTCVRAGMNFDELPWFQLTKAMAEYRLSHFTNALEWAQKVPLGENSSLDAEACSILAMAHYKLHHLHDASLALAKGLVIAETKLPKVESGDLGEDWRNWIIAHALLHEAQAMIEDQPPPSGK